MLGFGINTFDRFVLLVGVTFGVTRTFRIINRARLVTCIPTVDVIWCSHDVDLCDLLSKEALLNGGIALPLVGTCLGVCWVLEYTACGCLHSVTLYTLGMSACACTSQSLARDNHFKLNYLRHAKTTRNSPKYWGKTANNDEPLSKIQCFITTIVVLQHGTSAEPRTTWDQSNAVARWVIQRLSSKGLALL